MAGCRGQGQGPATTLALPFEPASVGRARRRLADELAAHRVGLSHADDALLVVSELVGNALRHARPTPAGGIEVRWTWRHGELEIAVIDGGGPTRPRVLHPPLSALGGRGLAIVSGLAARWGVQLQDHRTRVYAVIALRRAAANS